MKANNLIANYVGTVWITVIQLAVFPLYLRYLGLEAVGVLGLLATLTTLAMLIDIGLTPTLSRELARLSNPEHSGEIRSIVRSFEVVCWTITLVAVAIALIFIPQLLTTWLNPSDRLQLEFPLLTKLMIVQIGCQLLVGFYSGALLGIQRHVSLNIANSLGVTSRLLGGVAVLLWCSQTLEALLLWMTIATLVQVCLLAGLLYRVLPPGKSCFDPTILKSSGRYAAGITGIVGLSLMLTQIDKIVLSRQLSLTEFGLYSLASTIAMTLSKPISPLFNTIMPRMTQLVAQGHSVDIAKNYHLATQIAALLVIPASVFLIIFCPQILSVWLDEQEAISAIIPIVRLLAAGFSLNALLMLPYCVSLAYGWVRFGLYQNLVACIVMVPLTIWLARTMGATGGALAWLLLNAVCMFVSVFVLHKRYLRDEYASWYLTDILPVLVIAVAIGGGVKIIIGSHVGLLPVLIIVAGYISALVAVVLVLASLRSYVRQLLMHFRGL